MTAFKIRRFVPETDNSGLLQVARTLAIPARVQLGIDRSPDFAAFDRLSSDSFEILVAEAAGEIVGFIELCLGRFQLHGRDTMGVHAPLGGVRPDWRRRGVLTAMLEEGFRHARLMGAQWAYILVNANNRLMQENLRRSFPDMICLDRLLVHGILIPWIPFSRRSGSHYDYEIAPLAESEWPEFLDFVLEMMQTSDLYPDMEASRWRALPGCATEAYHVARDRSGRIVASLGSWDPSVAKRALILGYSKLERILLIPGNRLLSLAGKRPFPAPGGHIKLLYALCPLARSGYEGALGQMITELRADRRDCNAVLIAFPEGDPRNRIIKKFMHFTNVNVPHLIPLTPGARDELRQRPPKTFYMEYAFH